MKREFLQNLTVDGKPLSKEVIDAIMAQNGQDIEAARQASAGWEEKYNLAVADHKKALAQVKLDNAVQTAVTKAGGRNLKAIAALLDLQALANAEDPEAAIEQAVQGLQQECAYLFAGAVPPPYGKSAGLGESIAPLTLAGALRERMKQ